MLVSGSSNVRTLVGHPTDAAILLCGNKYGAIFQDAFVTKLNSSGSGLLFSTFLGGSSERFWQWHCSWTATETYYVVGQTTSTNFPTVNAIQSTPDPYR